MLATKGGEGFNSAKLLYDPFRQRNTSCSWWLESWAKFFVALENEWNYDRLAGLVA